MVVIPGIANLQYFVYFSAYNRTKFIIIQGPGPDVSSNFFV